MHKNQDHKPYLASVMCTTCLACNYFGKIEIAACNDVIRTPHQWNVNKMCYKSSLSFVGLQLYSEIIVASSHWTTHACAFHLDTTALADGTYELIFEFESEQREAQVNLTEVVEDPNQNSEESKTSFAWEGKPEHEPYCFQLYAIFLIFRLNFGVKKKNVSLCW